MVDVVKSPQLSRGKEGQVTNRSVLGLGFLIVAAPLGAQVSGDFFEQKIRPVLATKSVRSDAGRHPHYDQQKS